VAISNLAKQLLSLWIISLIYLPLGAQESFMVVEAHSGKIFAAQNSTVKRPVASLTKICTGVIATDWALATKQDLKKVMATVLEVDLGRKRISLSLKTNPEIGAQSRGPRDDRSGGGRSFQSKPAAKAAPQVDWFTAAMNRKN
jgi:hypothetical protein